MKRPTLLKLASENTAKGAKKKNEPPPKWQLHTKSKYTVGSELKIKGYLELAVKVDQYTGLTLLAEHMRLISILCVYCTYIYMRVCVNKTLGSSEHNSHYNQYLTTMIRPPRFLWEEDRWLRSDFHP